MKLKLIAIFIFTIAIANCYSQDKYVVPSSLNAKGYAAHVELTWQNYEGFTYDIYVSTNNGKTFVKRAQTKSNYHIDFVNDLGNNLNLTYRIIPEGMDVKSQTALKFQRSANTKNYSDDELLNMIQQYTTRYFYDFAEPVTKMARERSNDRNGDIVTTGGTGFGIMALIAGANRDFFPRKEAYVYIKDMVEFLSKAERFHGAWAHWYDARTGKVRNFGQYDNGGDLVETAFLVQGLLTARQYFLNGNAEEQNLSNKIQKLWEEVEWNWYTQGRDSLYWHWSKDFEWKMNHVIKGFDETLITYVLAASSPTYPIKPDVYHKGFTNSPYFKNNKTYYGINLALGMPYGGPLFFTHYSFLALNPNKLYDHYANYFERNRSHALIHYKYAIDNPKKHKGYGANAWGFTSSDDPLVGYSSHHPGTNDENGTIAPTAAIASIVYSPKESMQAINFFYYKMGVSLFNQYGFYDSFNLGMVKGQQVVRSYLAIDQGPIAVMIENYRSGLLWKLFAQDSDIQNGLKKLGFYYK